MKIELKEEMKWEFEFCPLHVLQNLFFIFQKVLTDTDVHEQLHAFIVMNIHLSGYEAIFDQNHNFHRDHVSKICQTLLNDNSH